MLVERLEQEINSFNSLAKKHGHKMRLKYLPDQEMCSGRLVLGREEQFEYDVYEAVLTFGPEESYAIAKSFRMYHCAEFGE